MDDVCAAAAPSALIVLPDRTKRDEEAGCASVQAVDLKSIFQRFGTGATVAKETPAEAGFILSEEERLVVARGADRQRSPTAIRRGFDNDTRVARGAARLTRRNTDDDRDDQSQKYIDQRFVGAIHAISLVRFTLIRSTKMRSISRTNAPRGTLRTRLIIFVSALPTDLRHQLSRLWI